MTTWTGGFSGRSAYTLRFTVNQVSQDLGANRSTVQWDLRIVESPNNGSWSNNTSTWSVTVDGQTWSGSFTYDFRSYDTLVLAGSTKVVGHDGNGYKTISASAAVGGSTVIGNASAGGSLGLTRIPKAPDAPTPVGIDNITPTSMRYRFSGNSNNGAAIDTWQYQYAESPGFTQNPVAKEVPGGTNTVSGLKPATTYYWRSRGHNRMGWGAWSSVRSARTLSGAYVSNGTSWVPCEVFVSDGSSWDSAVVTYSDGDSWENAG